jgi:Glycine/D-amino acid oxidases (deaminating)
MSPNNTSSIPRQPVENATVPFWHRDIHELHDHRTTEELPVSSDVVIIGAGYAGISTAYHLTKGEASDKSLSITILEARGVCSGATGRNGGHLRPDMYTPMTRLIDRAGVERALEVTEFEIAHVHAIKTLVEKEKIDCDFSLTRSIDVWTNGETAQKATDMYDTLVSRNLEYMKDVFLCLAECGGYSGVKGAKACASFTAVNSVALQIDSPSDCLNSRDWARQSPDSYPGDVRQSATFGQLYRYDSTRHDSRPESRVCE